MKAKQMIALGAVAGMTALAPQTFAADAEVKADVNLPAESEVELKRDRLDAEVRTDKKIQEARENRVLRSNKASGLLGMEVKNEQDEKLGEIKDLVLDIQTGKLSYAVMAVGGFLGLGEKLLAVPADAFKVSDQDGHLLLNADKAKIEAAPGFAATNWPPLDDPNLESRTFWLGSEATGAPARTETDRNRGVKIEAETDSDRKIYTDADEKKAEGRIDVDIDE